MAANTYNAADMTASAPVQAIHVGIAHRTITHTLGETATATLNINLGRTVPGMRIVGGQLRSNQPVTSHTVGIEDSLGNVYLRTANLTNGMLLNGPDLNTRITGSAHIVVAVGVSDETATAALNFELDVFYKTEERGD